MKTIYLVEAPSNTYEDDGSRIQVACATEKIAQQVCESIIAEKVNEIFKEFGDVIDPVNAEEILADEFGWKIGYTQICFEEGKP
tara:strand:- start:32 stop:283 length:252 start_codon:yes stop_codon:yes gene_type:complete